MGAWRGTRSCNSSSVACARVGVEALHHRIAEERVGEGHERHALVMRHVRPHDRAPGAITLFVALSRSSVLSCV